MVTQSHSPPPSAASGRNEPMDGSAAGNAKKIHRFSNDDALNTHVMNKTTVVDCELVTEQS